MNTDFKTALKNRRSIYAIDDNIKVSDKEIEDIIDFAVLNVPSAFNSQSTRVLLLLGDQHVRLWDIVKNTLRKIVHQEAFKNTEKKIDGSFASGYGTVLFFEDITVIEDLQKKFPTYSDNFPAWSQQTSAMHQLAIWTMLEDAGLGASLQHYNPLIDEEVIRTWKLNNNWKLIAQMPFGNPLEPAGVKDFKPLDKRVMVFK